MTGRTGGSNPAPTYPRLMDNDILIAVTTALISPLFLKLAEWILNKNSESRKKAEAQAMTNAAEIKDLREKMELLRELTIRQDTQIQLLKTQLHDRDIQIAEQKARIGELEAHVERLQNAQTVSQMKRRQKDERDQ